MHQVVLLGRCGRALAARFLPFVLAACPGGGGAPPPPGFAGCGSLVATVTGQFGMGTFAPTSINTTANVNETGTSITWEVPAGSTGRVIDGNPASGTTPTTGTPRNFTATGTSGDHRIDVAGAITGPPPTPCTANGTWTVTLLTGGQVVGRGRWRIP